MSLFASIALVHFRTVVRFGVGVSPTEHESNEGMVFAGVWLFGMQMEELCEVQSDKAAVEITSRYTGKIVKVYAKVGLPLPPCGRRRRQMITFVAE